MREFSCKVHLWPQPFPRQHDTTPKGSIPGMLSSTTFDFQSQPPQRSGMNHAAYHHPGERLLPGHHLWVAFACQSIFGSSPPAPLYILWDGCFHWVTNSPSHVLPVLCVPGCSKCIGSILPCPDWCCCSITAVRTSCQALLCSHWTPDRWASQLDPDISLFLFFLMPSSMLLLFLQNIYPDKR